MSGSTISGTITHTVRLGTAGYLSPLTIAPTGTIAPMHQGASAIFVPAGLLNARIDNKGQVDAAFGNGLVNGGSGIKAKAAVALTNSGTISGGDVGTVTNTGVLRGGNGVDLTAGGSVKNTGVINGGSGSYGFASSTSGPGGIGVDLRAGGTIVNDGKITGGNGGYEYSSSGMGGAGVQLGAGGMLSNTGTITGGKGGPSGYQGQAAAGGTGVVLLRGGNIDNSGYLAGGVGQYEGGAGGVGVQMAGGTLTNAGTIIGGGGAFSFQAYSGAGGVGVDLSAGATLTSTGSIFGGDAGAGHNSGGNGGAGVVLRDATFFAGGSVTGGAGGFGDQSPGGVGGVGVYVDGGTLVAAGIISAGTGYGAPAPAVQFSSQAGTIVLERGAVFKGAISGFATGDVLDSTRKVTSLTFISGTLTLGHNNKAFEKLSLTGTFTAANFHLAADGHGGTDITYGTAGQALPDFATGALDAGNGGNAASREHASPPAWYFGDHDAGSAIAVLASHPHSTS